MLHSWEVLASILSSDNTLGILCDIGMYVHLSMRVFFFFCIFFFRMIYVCSFVRVRVRRMRPGR